MMTIDEAKQVIREVVRPLQTEVKELKHSLNHVLAEGVLSKVFLPAFNRSAMDGFACRECDLAESLKVVETIPAGYFSAITIGQGECARIMTGAPVPDGADTVIMLEHVKEEGDTIRFIRSSTNKNISLKGEDLKPDDIVLSKGTLLKSQHIAILASAGVNQVCVFKKPRVGIISTGSELLEPGSVQQPGMIFNSNGHQLCTRLEELGINAQYFGIGRDNYDDLKAMIRNAAEQTDVLLITGGVSVGDYDYVPSIVDELGFEIHITKVAAKPGKHTLFAAKTNKYVLGLPGNPVSTFIQFEECGRLLVNALMGSDHCPTRIRTQMAVDYKRKRADRFELLPVKINAEGRVEILNYHGSAHMHSLSLANALLEIPIDTFQYHKMDEVYVRPL